jgi:4-amino-4-deoxy-L-arabinose transferase-like glycosyltransferase
VKLRLATTDRKGLRSWILGHFPLLIIVATAILLRAYRLADVPTGLLYDEAYNGLDVTRILSGDRPIFLSGNFGRESLFIYLQAFSVLVNGPTDLALRLVSAVVGILTVPASYFLVRRLFDRYHALLACAWLSVSLWHVVFSRIGLRSVSLPLFVTVSFLCLWKGLDQAGKSPRTDLASWHGLSSAGLKWFALAGFGIGTSLYTYTSARFVPLVVVIFSIYLALVHGQLFRRAVPGLVLAGAVSIVVFVPEGVYFWGHPADFVQRASEVSVFNPTLNHGNQVAAIADSARRTLEMFSWRGDSAWDRNIPDRPIFDPLSSLCFALGLVVVAMRWREPRSMFVLCWFAIMLLPSVLTLKDVPDFLRVTGTIPAIFCFPAIGAAWIGNRLKRHTPTSVGRLPFVAASIAFVVGAALTYHDYFHVWAVSPRVHSLFNADHWVGIEASRPALDGIDGPVYVDDTLSDGPLATFGFYGIKGRGYVRTFHGAHTLPITPDRASTYIFGEANLPPSFVRDHFLSGGTVFDLRPKTNGFTVAQYHLTYSGDAFHPEYPYAARFGDSLQVIGFDAQTSPKSGDPVTVRWYWRTLTQDTRRLTFFNQLVGPHDALVGQLDDQPFLPASLPPGSTGISWFDIPVNKTMIASLPRLTVGVYDLDTMERLPLFDSTGTPRGNTIVLGEIDLQNNAARLAPL